MPTLALPVLKVEYCRSSTGVLDDLAKLPAGDDDAMASQGATHAACLGVALPGEDAGSLHLLKAIDGLSERTFWLGSRFNDRRYELVTDRNGYEALYVREHNTGVEHDIKTVRTEDYTTRAIYSQELVRNISLFSPPFSPSDINALLRLHGHALISIANDCIRVERVEVVLPELAGATPTGYVRQFDDSDNFIDHHQLWLSDDGQTIIQLGWVSGHGYGKGPIELARLDNCKPWTGQDPVVLYYSLATTARLAAIPAADISARATVHFEVLDGQISWETAGSLSLASCTAIPASFCVECVLSSKDHPSTRYRLILSVDCSEVLHLIESDGGVERELEVRVLPEQPH